MTQSNLSSAFPSIHTFIYPFFPILVFIILIAFSFPNTLTISTSTYQCITFFFRPVLSSITFHVQATFSPTLSFQFIFEFYLLCTSLLLPTDVLFHIKIVKSFP